MRKLKEFLPWTLAGSLMAVSLWLLYASGVRIRRISEAQPESIHLCGTFEAPGKVAGSIVAEDFEMVITKDGALIDPGPEDRIRLRICE